MNGLLNAQRLRSIFLLIAAVFTAASVSSCRPAALPRQTFEERGSRGTAYGSLETTPPTEFFYWSARGERIIGQFLVSSLPGTEPYTQVGIAFTATTTVVVDGKPIPGGMASLRRGSSGSTIEGRTVLVRYHVSPIPAWRIAESVEVE